MKKECVEVEVHLNGNLVVFDRAVPVQKDIKKLSFAFVKVEDFKFEPGTLEIWVREVNHKWRART